MKQPARLPLDKIYSILPEEAKQNKKMISFHHNIGVVLGINGHLLQNLFNFACGPFLLEDYRMGLILRGSLHGIINLREHVMREGMIVFVTPGTIVEPIEVSEDFVLVGMGLSADEFHLAHGGKLPQLFYGETADGRKTVSPTDFALVSQMMHLLHDLLEREPMACKAVIYNTVSAITHLFDQLFSDTTSTAPPSHSKEIFNRFLRLVNLHGCQEHQLSFYAERLCITTRYLGTIVQATSGIGAKTWIDRAIIASAKVMLRHSDKQTAQIADELHFPNASFFCKYFKRLVGITPQQFRNSSSKN